MASQFLELLKEWHPRRDSEEWVLGTIYKTEGPCYRKTGAMMFFNGVGEQFGMLSGGCLESDIQQHARRVMQNGKAVTLCYDGSDEDDISFQLGIGCGGTVYILLQPITESNNYLCLNELYDSLSQRKYGILYLLVPKASGEVGSRFAELHENEIGDFQSELINDGGEQWVVCLIKPQPHIMVVGGGIDARPMVSIAHEMGWRVSLWDPRPANARRQFYLTADKILEFSVDKLSAYALNQKVDAAILMAHNIKLDSAALQALNHNVLKYIALLGPTSRRVKVIRAAGLVEDEIKVPLSGPAGLDIGGELPESIAMSILSECHAKLHNCSAQSISDIL